MVIGPIHSNSYHPYSHSKITSHTLRFLKDLISNNNVGMEKNDPKYVTVVDQPQLGTILGEAHDKLEELHKLEKSNCKEYMKEEKEIFPKSVTTTCQP